MEYTFNLLGVSPVLHFFNHQEVIQSHQKTGVQYVGAYRCTLDAFLESVETVAPDYGWTLDRVVDTVIHYWMNNADSVRLWKERLDDAGDASLIVGRVADFSSLRTELESLWSDAP